MSNNVVLNDVKVNNLLSNLDIYHDLIEKSLFEMNEIISNISSSVEGNIGDEILSKYNEFEGYFPIINDNIKGYITDFKSLVSSFVDFDSKISIDDVNDVSDGGGDIINVKN